MRGHAGLHTAERALLPNIQNYGHKEATGGVPYGSLADSFHSKRYKTERGTATDVRHSFQARSPYQAGEGASSEGDPLLVRELYRARARYALYLRRLSFASKLQKSKVVDS